VPYTYRHLDGRTPPTPPADVYRVETFIEFTRVAIHGNVHYVPGLKLDEFFFVWGEQRGEVVIDV
jgi:hypothetical protein